MSQIGLFGQATNNQSSQNSGSLFGFNPGNTNQNPTQNNNNQQTQQSLFGAQQTGNIGTNLFGGQQNQNNNQAGGSLFGTGQSSNQAGTTSLFGTSQNQNSNQGVSTPLFGGQNQNNNNQPNQNNQSTNLFGAQNNNQTTNSLFGNSTQTNNQNVTNLFGNTAQNNNQSTNNLLGQNNKPTQSTSLFGSGQPSNQENKPLFNAPQTQNQDNKPQAQSTGSLFGAQPAQTNNNPQQNTSLFGNDKKDDKPQGGTQGGQGASLFGTSNQQPQPQQGTSLFGQKPPESSTTNNQPTGNAGANEQQKKQEESKPEEPKEKLPLKLPTAVPNEVAQLDNLSLNYLYKRTMDETVTQWRNELDFQSTKMKQLTDIYRDFEGKLFNNYDSIMSMSYYRQRLQNDSDTALTQLKDINSEEDQIIEQLMFMDKSLTKYLDETEKFYPYDQDKESQLYNNITKITKEVDEIGNEIAKANSKVEVKEDEHKNNYKDDNYGFNYENEPFHEKIFIDKKEMNDILNSFYVAVRAIKTMEGNLTKKLQQVEMEINEKKQEVTYGNNVNMNYNYNNNGY